MQVTKGRLTAAVGNEAVVLSADARDSFFDVEGQSPSMKFVKRADGSFELHADGGVATRKQP